MKTLLLVAGRSRRFWPLAEKSLVNIAGKPLLAHQLERLREAGCTDITLVGGAHNLAAIRALFPDVPTIEQEHLDLGMQGALLSSLPSVGAEPVLIVSGNDVVDPAAYGALLKAATHADGALLAQRVDHYFPGGYLSVAGDRITGIVEKPGEGKEPSDLVNIVAHIHNDPAALLLELRRADSQHDDGYERALAALFATKTYRAVPYDGLWRAVKYPWHLLTLLPALLEDMTAKPRISQKAFVHPSACVEGNVVIEDGARILQHATVSGPCFVGKNAVIGTGSLVRGSCIGEHCIIGFGSEIKGSLLQANVWTHMTYIGDSVIGDNVSFGGGTVTGNFRLDEAEISSVVDGAPVMTGLTKFGAIIGEGCRIGIQVGTNPGVKIGAGSFVAGGAYVSEDIPDRSFVRMKDGKLLVRENRSGAPSAEDREKYRASTARKTP